MVLAQCLCAATAPSKVQALLPRRAASGRPLGPIARNAAAGNSRPADDLLAAALLSATTDLKQTLPTPPGLPFFGLDCGFDYDLSVLEAIGQYGIFRKYGYVLELEAGLGGRARWMALRLGCRAVGLSSLVSTVVAASWLNQRAGCTPRVAFQVGRNDAIPMAQRTFTHVLWLMATREVVCSPPLREAWRVARPGGYLVLHGTLDALDEIEWISGEVAAARFVDVVIQPVRLGEPPEAVRTATHHLRHSLEVSPALLRAWGKYARERRPLAYMLFARRPA